MTTRRRNLTRCGKSSLHPAHPTGMCPREREPTPSYDTDVYDLSREKTELLMGKRRRPNRTEKHAHIQKTNQSARDFTTHRRTPRVSVLEEAEVVNAPPECEPHVVEIVVLRNLLYGVGGEVCTGGGQEMTPPWFSRSLQRHHQGRIVLGLRPPPGPGGGG